MEQNCVDLTAIVNTSIGVSGVEGILGYQEAGIVKTEANTNLFYPSTALPYAKTDLSRGKHLLVSLITGRLPKEEFIRPKIEIGEKQITVIQGNEKRTISLS